jgi:hypothetical protein
MSTQALYQILVDVDTKLESILIGCTPDDIRKSVLDILKTAAATPGRPSKLRATFLLERMAEIAQDLNDSGSHGFYKIYDEVMLWVDMGATKVAYLVNPEAKGNFLASFDQNPRSINVRNPKDPAVATKREEDIANLLSRWEATAHEGPSEPRIIRI